MYFDIAKDYEDAANAAQGAGVFADFRAHWESELLSSIVEKRRTIQPTTIFMKVLTNRS